MQEIELKFQVPAAQRAAVERWVKGSRDVRSQRLQAAYFDTPERALARAGFALRLRREGTQWVQTLKGAGADGMSRLEHNVPLPARGAALPALDPARHAGHPAGERLLALLATPDCGGLQCLYRTDIQRLSRPLRDAAGRVELAFDQGELLAEREGRLQRLPVCELEIELLDGSPAAVLDVARHHAARLGLWLDSRSKAERGDLLARGLSMRAPQRAERLKLPRDCDTAHGLRVALLSCLAQILPNFSQLADGCFEAEHLHQARIGLRRLRCALRLYEDLPGLEARAPALAALAEQVTACAALLGQARDADVQGALFATELEPAWRALGGRPTPNTPEPEPGRSAAAPELAALLRTAPFQPLLLALISLVQPLSADVSETAAPPRLRPLLRQRLQRWLLRLQAHAEELQELDAEGRHALRQRLRRLRYGLEFGRGLLPGARCKPLLRPLVQAQQALGDLNDLALAIERRRAGFEDQPLAARTAFELGWLLARQQQRLAELPAQLAPLRGTRLKD